MSVDQHIVNSAGDGSHVLGVVKNVGRSEIEIGLLQMQILWILKRKKMHGYELMKRLNAIKNTKITQGTLYPAMQRLVELGLVDYEEDTRRKIYSVTKKGSTTMSRACADFVSTFSGIFEEFVCMRCAGSEIVFIGKEKK